MAERRDVVVGELIVLRVLLLAMAGVAIYTGLLLLTSPLWVPVTIAIWLSAAPMIAFAVLAKLPHDLAGEDPAVERFAGRRAA